MSDNRFTLVVLIVFLLLVGFAVFLGWGIRQQEEQSQKTTKLHGRNAYHIGAPVLANPYKNRDGQLWLEGYMEAQKGK